MFSKTSKPTMAGDLHIALYGIPTSTAEERAAARTVFESHPVTSPTLKAQVEAAIAKLPGYAATDPGDPVDPEDPEARERARDAVYRALALYFDREATSSLGPDFGQVAREALTRPDHVLAEIANRRQLPATDLVVDALLAEAMAGLPKGLRRRVLLTYLGFPFYDTVTLPLLRGEGTTEFDPAKVDRISPDDCTTIRQGGAQASLRGVEFYNFGAFFSRAYRENDYLWGRLHGVERMLDLVASALPAGKEIEAAELLALKREAFLAVLDEEEPRLRTDPALVAGIRREVEAISI